MCSWTPAYGNASHDGIAHVAFDHNHSLRSREFIISWLNHTPHATAVYASCSALPPPHATLASRRLAPLPGPDLHRLIAPASLAPSVSRSLFGGAAGSRSFTPGGKKMLRGSTGNTKFEPSKIFQIRRPPVPKQYLAWPVLANVSKVVSPSTSS